MHDDARFDDAVGRYVYLTLDGVEYRVYFEESGTGDVGMLLQHTAGADGRQWRHLLEDAELQRRFRMIAYDLPYHGKSVPPLGKPWWTEEYRLTRDFLLAVPTTLARALGLERPVYMGSSIGGHLAIDLALSHPREFRAVVGLEASAYTPGGFVDEFNHPRIGNDFKAHLMYGMMAPMSPEALRRETAWVYSQGAPGGLQGRPLLLLRRPRRAQHRGDHRHRRVLGRHPERRIRLERHPGSGRRTRRDDPGCAVQDHEGIGSLPDERRPGAFPRRDPPGARTDSRPVTPQGRPRADPRTRREHGS